MHENTERLGFRVKTPSKPTTNPTIKAFRKMAKSSNLTQCYYPNISSNSFSHHKPFKSQAALNSPSRLLICRPSSSAPVFLSAEESADFRFHSAHFLYVRYFAKQKIFEFPSNIIKVEELSFLKVRLWLLFCSEFFHKSVGFLSSFQNALSYPIGTQKFWVCGELTGKSMPKARQTPN